MIILHGGVLEGRPALWGEIPVEACKEMKTRRGRKPKRPRARAHPFAASAQELEEALQKAGVRDRATGTEEAGRAANRKVETGGRAEAAAGQAAGENPETLESVVWLPSTPRGPLPSDPILGEGPESRAAVALVPWKVPALVLDLEEVLDFLSLCREGGILHPGVLLGPEPPFFRRALRLAAALAARGRILPGLELDLEKGSAVWRPAPDAGDREALAGLAREMPPSARALTSADDGTPPSSSPSGILAGFVSQMVDHLARPGASEAEGPEPAKRGKAPGRRRRKTASRAFDSIHDHWVHALRAPNGAMEGADPRELASLARQIRDWRKPLAATEAAPFRLIFRLEEPPSDGEPWHVRYLVQAADDPSLQVPAGEVWKGRSAGARALKRTGSDPRAFLLGSLGQASTLCAGIEKSLKGRTPADHPMDTDEAFEFLSRTSFLLRTAGFRVQLPAWWTGKGTKQRFAVRGQVRSPKLTAASGVSLGRVVSVDWEVVLAGEALTAEELEELARAKAPLVRLRGQWVEAGGQELLSALKSWQKKGTLETKTTLGSAVRMSLGAQEAPVALEVEEVGGAGWVGEVLERLQGRRALTPEAVPDSFTGTLRPYQERGYAWMAFVRDLGLGGCLADDMGLGKTIQALALVLRDQARGEKRPVLLVCPTSVVGNWEREAARFAPEIRVMAHHGGGRARGAAFARKARKNHLVVSSYGLLRRDLDHLEGVEWAGIILDEAQNIKNPETLQARAARSLEADYRLALTGTPVENHVGDLWSIMEFLNPGLLGTQQAFRGRFFLPIQVNRDPEAARELRRITGPFILRRTKTDRSIITDLPEKQEMKVFCGLTREQASLYRAVVKETEEALEEAEGIQRKGLVLATISKLKQVCNHPAQLLGDGSAVAGRSGKLARLTEMLEEALSVGDRALLFTQFAEMGHLLKTHLQEQFGREVPFLHGGVPKKRRDAMVESFQSPAGPPLFILSLKAGGTGLNLTRANHVFHYDRWWNPAVEDQATDRAFRIGQTRKVQVHKFLCGGTMEEAIDEMIESKKGVASQVVGSGEGWLTEMSNEELRKVFALRAQAMEE